MKDLRCPYCRSKMDLGEVAAPHWIKWAKEAHWYSGPSGGVTISSAWYRTTHTEAYKCNRCRIIIIRY